MANLKDLSFGTYMKQTVKTSKVYNVCLFKIGLESRNCHFHLQGRSYDADIVLKCTGLTPNTSLTRSIFGENIKMTGN